jgi:hypothetical protein
MSLGSCWWDGLAGTAGLIAQSDTVAVDSISPEEWTPAMRSKVFEY